MMRMILCPGRECQCHDMELLRCLHSKEFHSIHHKFRDFDLLSHSTRVQKKDACEPVT